MSWFARRFFRSSQPTRRSTISQRVRPTLQRLDDRALPSNTFVGLGAAQSFGLLEINGGDLRLANHAHVTGAVGVGANGNAYGSNSNVDGSIFVDPSANTFFGAGFTATGGVVSQNLSQAVLEANGASGYYQQLAPTQTFNDVKRSLTLNGNGGLNIIRMRSLDFRGDRLTFNGSANDLFVINVARDFTFRNSRMVLQGGVTADHILFNVTTIGASVDIRNASSVLYGTFLVPRGNLVYQNPANFQGAIVARNVGLHTRADLNNGTPLPPPPPTSNGSLSGTIFEDFDFSGTQEAGEFGLAHFVVTLYDANGNQVGNAFETQEGVNGNPPDGQFSFTNLQAGTYTLIVTPDVGYITVSDHVGTLGGDDNPQPDPTPDMGHDIIASIVLGAGQQGTGYNFGAQNVGQ
jgi:SdrD B-like domain